MPRFLIQGPHDPDPLGCAEVVGGFLRTGSHYLTHADWGCADGVHTAWMIVAVDSRNDALRIVPPAFRGDAEVVKLNAFTLEGLAQLMRHHPRPFPPSRGR